jgi:thymidine phosphorylase
VDDYGRLPSAPGRHQVRAARAGWVVRLEAERIGRATIALGAGRDRVEQAIDPGVGAMVLKKPGDRVTVGEPIVELLARRVADIPAAEALVLDSIEIADAPAGVRPLVVHTVGAR